MDEEEWTPISTETLYTPGEEDVGHCLRLECRAILPDGEDVCMPRVITTEPVLSSERCCFVLLEQPPIPGIDSS